MDKMIDVLSKCPIFEGVSESELSNILQQIHYVKRAFRKNETIYRTGESSCCIGIIVSGCLEIKKFLPTGNVVSVFHRKRGEMIGGIMVFSSNPQYPCDVIAKENSEVVFIDKSYIFEVLFKNAVITSNLLRISANRIRQLEKRVELFSFSSIQQKIAFSLLSVFQTGLKQVVLIPFSKATWAEYLNVSRPSLSRELKALCEQEIIEMRKNEIIILRKDLLESLLFS